MTTTEPALGSPVAGCTHPRAKHTHGQRVAYVMDRCRCTHCRAATRAYENARSRRKAYGRDNRLVDAQPVREHIADLSAQGMGWKNVARAAGVANSTVYPILYGKYLDQPNHPDHRPPRKRVSRDIADKILAVELDLAGGALIHQAGTIRRLQALATCGWSSRAMAERIGWLSSNFTGLIHGRRGRVNAATAEKVRTLYDELWNQPPPETTRWEKQSAARARNNARSWRWVPPLGWDDDTIDDPYAQPELEDEPDRRGVDLDEVRWLLDFATAPDDIARRMGVTVSGIEMAARRADDLQVLKIFAAATAGHRRQNGRAA